jgi:hypothetical protein
MSDVVTGQRDFHEVISRMINECLYTGFQRSAVDFRKELEEIRSASVYAAPETMRTYWNAVFRLILKNIPQEQEKLNPWQRKVIEIWVDHPLPEPEKEQESDTEKDSGHC